MTAATWILIYKQPQDPAAAGEALKFFAWAYAKGGKMAEELDYVPMPAKVVGDIQKDVGDRDQGRERQADLRDDQLKLDRTTGKGAARRLFPFRPKSMTSRLCGGRPAA